MKAVILAAGDGERLAPLTRTLPKCLLPVGAETVIERLLRQCKNNQITEIAIVVGYQGDLVRERIGNEYEGIPLTYLSNTQFQATSTAFSAYLAKDWTGNEPFILIDGDLVMDDAVLRTLLINKQNVTIAFEPKSISSPEEMKVSKDQNGCLHLSKETAADQSFGEFIGITYFTSEAGKQFFAILTGYSQVHLKSAYYESALNDLTAFLPIETIEIFATQWVEIDFVTDYLEAVRLFADKRSQQQPSPISEQVLLCPGPVMVSKAVKSALLHADIGHRETEFIEILTRTRRKLLKVYGADRSGIYTNVIITGSGTAANEALLSTYGPNKRLLILVNGEFGNRLVDIARCHHLSVTPLEFGWMQPVDIDRVRDTLSSGQFDAVMVVHHETSTGMLNPIYQIGEVAKEYDVDFLVDAVSSIGAEFLDVEQANITFCTASANKAIASLPGLSFVCGKREAFAALGRDAARTRYLDLYKHYEYEELHFQTPNTPAVSLFYALETALDELMADGIEARMEHYEQLTRIIRKRLNELNAVCVIPKVHMSRVLTTVYYPDGIDVEAFHTYIKQHNYVIYRGKGPLLGKAFQIANIGHVTQEHVLAFLEIMEQAFKYAANANINTQMVVGS